MKLEKFLNEHEDWETLLAAEPYCLDIKTDGCFVLFKYNQFKSDMRLEICKEARGCIFAREPEGWRCVCYPFKKFFNWQEPYADDLGDWNKVRVQEKIDGSLIKAWCYKGMWMISTNGMINAFEANSAAGISYGELFVNIIAERWTVREFFESLRPDFCYMFELVSPMTKLVVNYREAAIYFIGARNMQTYEEFFPYDIDMPDWVKRPRLFCFNSFVEMVEHCVELGKDEEGYVCVKYALKGDSFQRVKAKGAEYLRLAKLAGNGVVTTSKIISMWQNEGLDDFLAAFPEWVPRVEQVVKKIEQWISIAEVGWGTVKGFSERKDVAIVVRSYVPLVRGYMFARLDGKVKNAREWFKKMDAKKIEELVEG